MSTIEYGVIEEFWEARDKEMKESKIVYKLSKSITVEFENKMMDSKYKFYITLIQKLAAEIESIKDEIKILKLSHEKNQ